VLPQARDENLILRSTRVVLPEGERPAAIHVEGGVIVRIDERSASAADNRSAPPSPRSGFGEPRRSSRGSCASGGGSRWGERLFDFGDLVISPGLVDTHVHVNEPGRTEWEGFDTATRAAAAGGVTTIVDMPLNSIPATTTVAALEAKRAEARGQCH